jgi:hypothetical protein
MNRVSKIAAPDEEATAMALSQPRRLELMGS